MDFKYFIYKIEAMHHLKTPAKIFCWHLPEVRTSVKCQTGKTNRVIFNGRKNTTNGVDHHHFNYPERSEPRQEAPGWAERTFTYINALYVLTFFSEIITKFRLGHQMWQIL